jgi:uncharacterized RDD family membrane protein YckC
MAAAAPPLDTIRRVATPEGCEIFLRVAGPVTRAQAWFYDFLLRLVGWFALALLAGYSGRLGVGVLAVGGFLLEWFYPILFEVHWQGQTPGKRACGLAVLHDDGRPVGWGAAFIRNTLRFVDFLPFLYATGFIATLLNDGGKRLGDLAAGTLVVHTDRGAAGPAASPDAVAGAEPPPFPLLVVEQQALIEYSRRLGQLTEERAAELAETAVPLAAGLPPAAARARLLRIANFLLGRS